MSDDVMRPAGFEGVVHRRRRLYTRNSAPGKRCTARNGDPDGVLYASGCPTAASCRYIRSGGTFFPFRSGTNVLYLGAASGTTASHVADIVPPGTVYCVEISPRSFRDLVPVCESRPNMVPFLADATKPGEYAFAVSAVDVVYQDIAQKGQAQIFLKNFSAFGAKSGLLVIKSRSEDVTQDPVRTYEASRKQLISGGLKVEEVVRLDPMEKDHAMIAVTSR
jgi:fibrillarin-like pre-rRNA processing protein